MLASYIEKLMSGSDLTRHEAFAVVDHIVDHAPSSAQIGALLVLLRQKGETAHELAGMADALRRRARKIDLEGILVDTCGTGGDGANTINLSTAAAMIAAAAGVRIAKHGNRSVSSRCGSADLLEALGIRISMDPEIAVRCLESSGMTFFYAPVHHPAMAAVSGIRRELSIRTVFNLLGPLTNPALVTRQTLGVFSERYLPIMASALAELGCEHGLVFHGAGGLDELTTIGPCHVIEIRGHWQREYHLDGATLGLQRATLEDLRGGDATENATAIRSILSGENSPRADSVILGAAAAVFVAGLEPSILRAVERTLEVQRRGEGLNVLQQLQAITAGGVTCPTC